MEPHGQIINLRMAEPEIFRPPPADGLKERTVVGRLAQFDSPVKRWWGKIEFAEGAFEIGKINPGQIPALWSHNLDEQIGDVAEVMSAKGGVDVRLRISLETQRGREVIAMADAGMLSGISPGVIIEKYDVVKKDDEPSWREHKRVTSAKLAEVSLVPIPAEESARVGKLGAARDQHPLHNLLRECIVGASKQHPDQKG